MNDNSSQTQFGGSITSKSDGKQLRWAENEKTEVGEKENVILANENEITLEVHPSIFLQFVILASRMVPSCMHCQLGYKKYIMT